MRDDFPQRTVRLLAQRTGHQCSNPDCRQPTSGPAEDEDKSVNLGVAAHITAASIGGPRYEASLTPEERRSAANGIWLCQNCAKLVDSDVERFRTDTLRKWKKHATEHAFREIATSPRTRARPSITVKLDEEDREFLRALGLPAEDDLDSVARRLLEASEQDLATYRRRRQWPAHALALNLVLSPQIDPQPIALEGLAHALGTADAVNLVSDPGTGKTTTLVQLGAIVAAGKRIVPVIVPLGEWSDREDDFFTFLCRRNAFGTFRPQHFRQAAYHGRLCLLLDGWNELDPRSRLRAIRDLETLQREFPLLGIVIGTRSQPLVLEGPIVEIQALTSHQQFELAQALRGEPGVALVDQAWRTPGVRELVTIPLYLTALVLGANGAMFPQTREEALRLFVAQHERAPEQREILARELFGCHPRLLTGLAVEANRRATTVLSDTDARRVIALVERELEETGQLRPAPQPTHVLDVLVNAHTLVRSAGGAGTVWFQHPQFQEWYASFDVEELMRRSAQGEAESRRRLRVDILNWSAWEESIFFACERLSREGPLGTSAVASAILETLRIDPMLTAEMIYRSSPETWGRVRDAVLAFAARWHQPGRVDRAFRFMLMTGRVEFTPQIWPLITDPNDQVHLHALRAAPRFRITILGPDAATHLAALPDATRGHVVSEIAHNSGFEGIELAAAIAKTDQCPQVVVQILQALEFRGAGRHVVDVMQTASDEVWRLLAQEQYPEELPDSALNSRLIELRHRQLAAERDPARVVVTLAEKTGNDPAASERIETLLRSPDFPINSDPGQRALDCAWKSYPRQTAAALASRVANGLELPFRAERMLELVPTVDDGPIVALALNPETPDRTARSAFALIGPRTVGEMIERFFALDDAFERRDRTLSDAESKHYHRLRNAIMVSRQTSFLPALLERAGSEQPRRIGQLAAILGRRGSIDEGEPLTLTAETREILTNVVQRWIEVLLAAPDASRRQFADVARAVGRLAAPRLALGLKQMLDRDLTDWDRARSEYQKSLRPGPVPPDVLHSYLLQYQRSFAAIDGSEVAALLYDYLPDPRFGVEGAGALLEIWRRQHASGDVRRITPWRDFSAVKAQRKAREDARNPLPTSESAERIFAVARDLGPPSREATIQRHAIALAGIALGLPHGSKRAEVDQLLALPQPYAAKLGLLTAAALAGEILSTGILLAGVRELLETAKTEWWRLEENHGELNGWLVLFAFADRPVAILEALDMLPAPYREPWKLREVLMALAQSPDAGALEALEALARRDPRIVQQYEWFNAIATLGTESAASALLRFVIEGTLDGRGPGVGVDAWHLAQQLAQFARTLPDIRGMLIQRYRELPGGHARAVLEAALAEIADPEIILAMIEIYAADRRAIDGRLYKAVRDVAVGRRPAERLPGAYEEFGVPLTTLRRQLFELIQAEDARSALAEASLIAIEEARDESGRPENEPRHPLIESDVPWPTLAPHART
jgi:hypothetical protein